MEVLDYTYYEGCTLTVQLVTMRPDAAPANVLTAGTLFTQYAAQVLDVLAEYKIDGSTPGLVPVNKQLSTYLPQSGGFPLYKIKRIQPIGITQEVDNDYLQDIQRIRLGVDFSILPTAWAQDVRKVKAFARNIQVAVQGLFEATDIPFTVIPEDPGVLGESYVSIMLDVGVGQEPQVINIAA